MSSAAADRNLLFGIVALQLDFVGRDALIAAMHAWVLRKSTPLGRILEEQGALSEARRSILDALVEEHLKLHGDDPQKSLAALSSIGSVREDLSRVADTQLQASLVMVSAARRESDDPYNTLAASSLGTSTSEGTRFRILRPHARGGLGQVSVALDRELDRPVALKEIQERHADEPESRARFVQEAEITGKLEHPGIVPVYGLGHDATGRPFYAMRFIQGDSLKEAIAAFHADEALRKDPALRSSRLRELLRRFTDVCNAVAYAHSRGVLHRDLKPGNIMLGPYGETLLVDWGLSKPIGTQGESHGVEAADPDLVSLSLTDAPIRLSGQSGSRADTVAGAPIGTPAFASPEQVLGRLDLLGPASDVYGLGATLYALLTGRAPVESAGLEETMRRVSKGDIPPPRSIDPTIPRPLEAICRKAMAVRPDDRYDSARALAEDVKRWMDDAPVSAYREPIAVRAARWVRRNQRLVTGAAAAVLVGLTSLGIAYSRESSINRKLLRAKDESDRRLDQTLQAVEDYYTGVGEEVLLGQKEFQALRARLLEKPRQFYEQLASELASDPAPDERKKSLLAKGRFELGVIYKTLSRYAEARAQFQSARDLLRALASARPGLREYSDRLATSDDELGQVQWYMGNTRDAAESIGEATLVWEKLVAAHPGIAGYKARLARGHNNLGKIRSGDEDMIGAARSYKKAIEICEVLVDADPRDEDALDLLALGCMNLGVAQYQSGDPEGAEDSLRRAVEIRTKLVARHPDDSHLRRDLAYCYNNLAVQRLRVGRFAAALEDLEKSRTILMRLVKEQPQVLEHKQLLASVLTNMGVIDMAEGRRLQGLRRFQEAVTYWKDPFANNPKDPYYSASLKGAPKALSDILGTKKSPQPAGPSPPSTHPDAKKP